MNQFRLALRLALAVLAGCSYFHDQEEAVKRVCGPDVEQVPWGRGVEIGHTYSFDVLTHCGIEWAYFNSHYWVPRKKMAVPSTWDPIERGTMTLAEPNVAHFEGTSPGKVDFVPAPRRLQTHALRLAKGARALRLHAAGQFSCWSETLGTHNIPF